MKSNDTETNLLLKFISSNVNRKQNNISAWIILYLHKPWYKNCYIDSLNESSWIFFFFWMYISVCLTRSSQPISQWHSFQKYRSPLHSCFHSSNIWVITLLVHSCCSWLTILLAITYHSTTNWSNGARVMIVIKNTLSMSISSWTLASCDVSGLGKIRWMVFFGGPTSFFLRLGSQDIRMVWKYCGVIPI